MQSRIGIDVAAPATLVFALAHDVERWATLLPHYVRSSAVDRRPDGSVIADFIARRPLVPILGLALPVTWRSRTWAEPGAGRLRFIHVAGATKGMDVTWRIVATDTGCRVTIDHRFEPAIPGLAWIVDRWFTRSIASRTLSTFKALAEALADDAHPASSERRTGTDPPT